MGSLDACAIWDFNWNSDYALSCLEGQACKCSFVASGDPQLSCDALPDITLDLLDEGAKGDVAACCCSMAR